MSSLKRSGSAPDLRYFKALRSDSNLVASRKSGTPWLTLFLDGGGCVLYNPKEGKIEKRRIDFSGSRFLASCGNWFLMLDVSGCKLYIIDVLSGKRKDLPQLDKVLSETYSLKKVGVGEFTMELRDGSVFDLFADEIRGRLWVDEKADEWSSVWFFDGPPSFLCFHKKGNKHYDFIPVRIEIPKMLTGVYGLVLRGYRLYILTTRFFVRVIDFSGPQGFEELTGNDPTPMFTYPGFSCRFSIAVTTKGDILFVTTTNFERSQRTFRLFKKDPNTHPDDYTPDLLEVDNLDNEALLLDLGITVPANHTLGIEPNCIYLSGHDGGHSSGRDHVLPPYEVDMCVFNLATNSLAPVCAPSDMKLKDARWLFPIT